MFKRLLKILIQIIKDDNNANKILSLSGRGKEISLEIVDYGKNVVWGKKKFELSDSL